MVDRVAHREGLPRPGFPGCSEPMKVVVGGWPHRGCVNPHSFHSFSQPQIP